METTTSQKDMAGHQQNGTSTKGGTAVATTEETTQKKRKTLVWEGEDYTFARAFLQLRQAFRVTDSGTLRRLELAACPSVSFSRRLRRDVDGLGVVVVGEALPMEGVSLSPTDGLNLRRDILLSAGAG